MAQGGTSHYSAQEYPGGYGWSKNATGISDATFYKVLAKYAEIQVHPVKELRQLEDKNRRLKQIVIEQAFDIQARKAITEKHWHRPKQNKLRPSGWPSASGGVSDASVGCSKWIGTRGSTAERQTLWSRP